MNAKVIFVSNDRNEEAFGASCKKNAGIDVMPYDTSKTRAMRDLFGITTISGSYDPRQQGLFK
jgi:hypothetical protein